MKKRLLAVLLCLLFPILQSGDGKKKDPPSLAGKPAAAPPSKSSKAETAPAKPAPPGLAKKTKLPPGLEKRFGMKRPDVAYVAFDPKHTDRAWLLIDGKWKLEEKFDKSLRGEVKASLALPIVKPPVPLPKSAGQLRVVKFE